MHPFLSTFLISTIPTLFLLVAPSSAPYLPPFKALAAGGLLGDVFLHGMIGGDPLGILAGFVAFLAVDLLLLHDHSDHAEHDDHAEEPEGEEYVEDVRSLSSLPAAERPGRTVLHHGEGRTFVSERGGWATLGAPDGSEAKARIRDLVLVRAPPAPAGPPLGLLLPGNSLLSIAADLLHNFTDGLTLGLTAATPLSLPTFLSILLHELPHELGDYAVLLGHGVPRRTAILLQFATASAAFLGAAAGLYLPAVTSLDFLPPVAGTFLYLACCSLLPEAVRGAGQGRGARLAVLGAFAAGVAIMYALLFIGGEGGCAMHDHGHHHHQAGAEGMGGAHEHREHEHVHHEHAHLHEEH